ncbi:hypothetical protein C1Y27_06115 [Pseudomonas sp. GW704-F2]|nr:hypothetical protein C1Y27_06115 [Pseudomonas sp. GW704-F2]
MQPNVGGGLPPIAVAQSGMYWLTHCHRGQAPSHILIGVHPFRHSKRALPVGSLPADQPPGPLLTPT